MVLKHNKNLSYPLITASMIIFLLQYTAGNLIRCQAFTFALIAITIYILEKLRQSNTKLVWVLPIMIAIWCNLHGGVASGLAIIGIYCTISLIKREKHAKTLVIVTLLSFLALFVNPYGIHYPAYLYSAVTVPRKFIEDWQSIFHPRFLFVYAWIIILFLSMLGMKIARDIKNKTFDIYHYVLIVTTIYFGFAHVKGIELAAIVTFMFCSRDMNYYLENFQLSKTLEKSLSLVIIILAITIPFNITTPRVTFERYPVREVEFLKINNIKGNIIAPFEIGSYLTYKLYPNNKIFIDGRYDGVYPMEIFDVHKDFMTADKKWTDALNKYPTDIIILRQYDPTRILLLANKQMGWKEVFTGDRFCVFLKKEKAKQIFILPPKDLTYYRNNAFKPDFIKYLKEEKND